jgi:hypothetical protein
MNKFISRLTLASLILTGFAAAQAETYALFIGVNDYPTPVDGQGNPLKDANGNVVDPDLKGCINDVVEVGKLLTAKKVVKAANVRTRTDKDANVTNFKADIQWLAKSAKTGDQVIFMFSGHGSEIPIEGSDKKDQAIVLGDDTLVVDKFFAEMSKVLAANGVNATYMFDSCFSGGMSRPPAKGKMKFRPAGYLSAKSKKNVPKLMELMKSVPVTAKAMNPSNGEYAFIFASQEDVPSIDFPGVPEKNMPPHGLFTFVLLDVLRSDSSLPVGPLMEAMEMIFEDTFKDMEEVKQRPQAEFSSKERAEKPIWLP